MSLIARAFLALCLLLPFPGWAATSLASLSTQLRENLLDPEACFQVRDFPFRRYEARLYLTDGFLIFRKPIDGKRPGALFVAAEEAGDAEILLIPPNRLERQSLNAFTGAPTLNEHFRLAAFLFSDGSGERWLAELEGNPAAKRLPDRGVLLAERWNPTMRNLGLSLETRLLEDIVNGGGPGRGFFFAAISSDKLGNFDLLLDPRAREELLVGQLVNEDGRSRYHFWTHYEPRRGTPRVPPAPPLRVDRFRVEARISSDLKFRAQVHLQVTATELVDVVPFDLSPRLRLGAARWNGQPAELFQREALRANLLRMGDSESALLRVPSPLPAGTQGTLSFDEEGDIFVRAGNGVLYLATRATWFPQIGWQAAPFEAQFRHPKNLTLVCPGLRTETVDNEEKVTTCKVERPVRLFGFNLGEFEHREIKRGGLEVELFANRRAEPALERPAPAVFLPPPVAPRRRLDVPSVLSQSLPTRVDPLMRLEEMSEEIHGALDYFRGVFGPPPMARVVAAPIPGTFGQGFPGFLYLSTLAYLDDKSLPAEQRAEWQTRHFRDLLSAHEVAHQWWGNLVNFDTYRDEWLAEALANYSALLYLEKKRGAKALETVLDEYRRRLLRADSEGKTLESAGPVVFGVRLRASNPQAWQTITYEKSSWILHMLRGRLGDAAFLALLGQLAIDFAGRPMNSEDLRRAAAARLPKGTPDPDLSLFFDTWVYSTGIPQYELTYVVRGAAPRARVEITLKQSKTAESFSTDVPIEILLPRGQRQRRWMRSGSEAETITVNTGAVPLKVQFDPKIGVLRQTP